MERSPSPEFDPLAFDEDLTPLPEYKAAGDTALDFSGLLAEPVKLHEDLKSGCGGQLWPAGMVLAKHMLRYHRDEMKTARMLVPNFCLLYLPHHIPSSHPGSTMSGNMMNAIFPVTGQALTLFVLQDLNSARAVASSGSRSQRDAPSAHPSISRTSWRCMSSCSTTSR